VAHLAIHERQRHEVVDGVYFHSLQHEVEAENSQALRLLSAQVSVSVKQVSRKVCRQETHKGFQLRACAFIRLFSQRSECDIAG